MLFKISVSNIRKSLRDYAIYFFTLIIGVSIFYVFNAIGTQTAYLKVSQNTKEIIRLLNTMLSGVSVFVSAVLGLLIVYASRFLMKRRNKEFGLYLMLGMGKGKISAILFTETLLIGIGSLFAGLFLGMGLSQIMSAVVANLFEADMSSYRFTVSTEAIGKTIIFFGIMYVVVMLFNSIVISRCKLIDLLQSGRRSEKLRLKNPIFCTLIFLLASVALGYAYYQVGFRSLDVGMVQMRNLIIIGIISTLCLFWSVSGLLLRITTSMKKLYFSSLNCFTFRQISSKINTTVMSMSVICLMLFVTICTLSGAFSIRNSMNANLKTLCPADAQLEFYEIGDSDHGAQITTDGDILKLYQKYGYDLTDSFSEYVYFDTYGFRTFTFADFFGDQLSEVKKQYPYLAYDTMEDFVRLSDYNRLMELYGMEPLEMNEDEFILLCDFKSMKKLRDSVLAENREITLSGYSLKSKYEECQDGFIEISAQHLNAGLFVVPDHVVGKAVPAREFFQGNYRAKTTEEKRAVEKKLLKQYDMVRDKMASDRESTGKGTGYFISVNTKIDIGEATIGLGAMIALLGLYIGLVFLISCGAILALKELSDGADSVQRYAMLRKIGAEEREISLSLFRQTGIFFLLPLLLACLHSVFGMKWSMVFLEMFGTEKLMESVVSTSVIILLIYGGYFMITYFCGRSIIRGQR